MSTCHNPLRCWSIRQPIKIASFIAHLGLLSIATFTWAQSCTPTVNSLAVNFPAAISVPRDAAVGTLLTGWSTSAAVSYNCQNLDRTRWFGIGGWSTLANETTVQTINVSGRNYAVFQTGIAGVGMIGRLVGNTTITPVPASPTSQVIGSAISVPRVYQTFPAAISLALVKIGRINSGRLNTGIFGRVATGYNYNPNGGNNNNYTLNMGVINVSYSATTITVPTCTINTPSVAVNMGTVAPREFGDIGSTSQTSRQFDIGVDCSAVGNSAVYMTMTDATNPANRTNQLSLTSASTATGVALQITFDNTARIVSFGPDSATVGSTNQFGLGIGNAIAVANYHFSVRYIKTAAAIKGGTANGLVTFTLAYQ